MMKIAALMMLAAAIVAVEAAPPGKFCDVLLAYRDRQIRANLPIDIRGP